MIGDIAINGFDWDEANIDHIALHNVAPEEAEDIFFDPDQVIHDDIKHSTGKEKRFIIIGKTENRRLLYQVFTIRGDKIRVVSSRDINKKEVIFYKKTINHS